MEDNWQLIASCGINCELCKAWQRDKNNCCGCNADKSNKPKYCLNCRIKYCPELEKSESKFCYVCKKFPCQRLRKLDKRYQLKYGMSMIADLKAIEKVGIKEFLEMQRTKWQCRNCGKLLTVHGNFCLHCGAGNPYFPVRKV